MISLQKYKWLLFDLDNTLVEFHTPSIRSFEDLCAEVQIDFSEQLYKKYKIENNKVWSQYERGTISSIELRAMRFANFFEKIGLRFDPMEAHHLYIQGLIKYSEPLPVVPELLCKLSEAHQLAIITNGLQEAQRPRLSKTGLDQYFAKIIVSDEIGLAKPQTEYFDYTMDHIGHHIKEELLIIGDTLTSDILGGENSGIDTVWYNPRNEDSHSSIKPTYVIEHLTELLRSSDA